MISFSFIYYFFSMKILNCFLYFDVMVYSYTHFENVVAHRLNIFVHKFRNLRGNIAHTGGNGSYRVHVYSVVTCAQLNKMNMFAFSEITLY